MANPRPTPVRGTVDRQKIAGVPNFGVSTLSATRDIDNYRKRPKVREREIVTFGCAHKQLAPKTHKLSFSHFWVFLKCVDISLHRQGRNTKIWYPGYFLTLNTMQVSISIQKEQIFR
eukprot:sb/3476499/